MNTHYPTFNVSRSRQDYATPKAFISAVEQRFGPIDFDLAANANNAVVSSYYDINKDSLAQDWTKLRGNLWLNPPFNRAKDFAQKCCESKGTGRRIMMLTPASIDTLHFRKYIHKHAAWFALSPRLSFLDSGASYPNALILSVYDDAIEPTFDTWQWKEQLKTSHFATCPNARDWKDR